MQNLWNLINGKRKPNYLDNILSGYHLSTTNPTRIVLGCNPDLRGDKPATNRQGCGTGPI